MVSLEVIALVFTGLGLAASITYYANVLSNANKTQRMQLEKRELDQFMSLYQRLGTQENWERYIDVAYNIECKDFDDFLERYGPATNPEGYARICSLWYSYVVVGDLVLKGTFSLEQVFMLFADMPSRVWDKWESIIYELRDYIGSPYAYLSFEYLVSELKRHRESNAYHELIETMKNSINNR